jgi:hypothetical protein
MPVAPLGLELWGRSVLNALYNNRDLGYATITHPYHPFQGQRFKILKSRKLSGEDTLILKGSIRGTFAVFREWTDRSDPDLFEDIRPRLYLSPIDLLPLAELLEQINKKKEI